MNCPLPNLYVELNPNEMVLGGEAFGRQIVLHEITMYSHDGIGTCIKVRGTREPSVPHVVTMKKCHL